MNNILVFTWNDLPDPRYDDGRNCAIRAYSSAWRHLAIDSEHLTNGQEPWGQWLGEDLQAAVVRVLSRPAEIDELRNVLSQASSLMAAEVRKCLKAPLVLLMRVHQTPSAQGEDAWILVLSNGASFCVADRPRRLYLKSCYFRIDRKSRKRRIMTWRENRDAYARRYGRRLLQQTFLPDPTDLQLFRTTKAVKSEWVSRVRFVIPEHWGFQSNQPNATWRSISGSLYPGPTR